MNNFIFYNPTKIFFGKGSISNLSTEIDLYKNILVTYGGSSIKKNGIYDEAISILKSKEKNVYELSGITPNPRLDKVYEGIKICKDNNIDFILAIGGGSVIDCSKAIAMGAETDIDVWDFYTKKETPKKTLPLGVILTISATGSEMNPSSVITNWETKEKLGTTSQNPKFSILDPTYTYTVPKNQMIYGSIDILAHLFEQYFSRPDEENLTDSLCETAIKTVIKNLDIALKNPQDYNSRANLMWCSTMALNRILGVRKRTRLE